MKEKLEVCACSKSDLLEYEHRNDDFRYQQALEKKNYLELALYNEFTSWQEGMAQDDEEYFNITQEEIWATIDKTIEDEEFTEEMFNCFGFYLNHNRKGE